MPIIKHKWILGEKFVRQDRTHSTREDKCELCNCTRTMVKAWVRGRTVIWPSTYERSKQVFSEAPECWGAPNPPDDDYQVVKRERCPVCKVGFLIEKWSGVACNMCTYTDCL